LRRHYLDGFDVLTAVVADAGGRVVGWQSVGMWQGEAHIGTFVRPDLQARGVGAGLFEMTRDLLARAGGVQHIIASIRADNGAGLAYYASAGFAELRREADFALRDGRVVGRVHKRFSLV
jgi:GNAT superfamily N-acetyltransferase